MIFIINKQKNAVIINVIKVRYRAVKSTTKCVKRIECAIYLFNEVISRTINYFMKYELLVKSNIKNHKLLKLVFKYCTYHCRNIMECSRYKRTLNVNCSDIELNTIIEKIKHEYPQICIETKSKIDEAFLIEVSLEAVSNNVIDAAEAMFRFFVPANAWSCGSVCKTEMRNAMLKYSERHLFVENSLSVIDKCLKDYKPSEICVGFNGGKDCTVLFHMVYSVFSAKFPNEQLRVFYIKMPQSFPMLDNFVEFTIKRYNSLKLLSYTGPDYKIALNKLKNDTEIKAIFMGTRISDLPKNVKISTFQMTDEGWPQFMRVCPLLHLSYHQVWCFIRDLNVAYCALYDRGYTSIGSPSNTCQNPLLKRKTKCGEIVYLPAYMLKDEEKERSGRTQ